VRRAAAAVALVAVLLGGCGAGRRVAEANRYVYAVNAAQQRFAATIDRLAARVTPTSTAAQDRATIAGFSVALDRVVGDLRAVRPPARVRGLHARLVGAISAFGDEVRSAGASLHSRDPNRVLDAQERLAAATRRVSQRINATIAAINRALRRS
jgi:hypothetical protein